MVMNGLLKVRVIYWKQRSIVAYCDSCLLFCISMSDNERERSPMVEEGANFLM